MKKLFTFYALTFIVICGSLSTSLAQNIYKKLTISQCDSLISANEKNPNFVILDVRTPSVWKSEHLLGSINRNFYDGDFEQQLDALPKQKTFLIHCQSGGRSGSTFIKMKNLQFSEVYDMMGGMNSWKGNSKPTTAELGPKLMLVGVEEKTKTNTGSDTLFVTLTNRANQTLRFSSLEIDDVHDVSHNFHEETTLEGAEDYTFSIIHTPGYVENDSTKFTLKSNGGNLDFSIVFKDGVVGIKEMVAQGELVVYPNPANDFIRFTSKGLNIRQISIININGQMVYQDSGISIQSGIKTSDFQNGIYLLRLDTEKESIVRKIIIQH